MISIKFIYKEQKYNVTIEDDCKLFLANHLRSKNNQISEGNLTILLKSFALAFAKYETKTSNECIIQVIKCEKDEFGLENTYSIKFSYDKNSPLIPLTDIKIKDHDFFRSPEYNFDENKLNDLLIKFPKYFPKVPFLAEVKPIETKEFETKEFETKEYSDENVCALFPNLMNDIKPLITIDDKKSLVAISDKIGKVITPLESKVQSIEKDLDNLGKEIKNEINNIENDLNKLDKENTTVKTAEIIQKDLNDLDEENNNAEEANNKLKTIKDNIEKQKNIIQEFSKAIEIETKSEYIAYQNLIKEQGLLKFKLAKSVYLGIATYVNGEELNKEKIVSINEGKKDGKGKITKVGKFSYLLEKVIIEENGNIKLFEFEDLYKLFKSLSFEYIQIKINQVLLECFNSNAKAKSYISLHTQLATDFKGQLKEEQGTHETFSLLGFGYEKKIVKNTYDNFNLKLTEHDKLSAEITQKKELMEKKLTNENNLIGQALESLVKRKTNEPHEDPLSQSLDIDLTNLEKEIEIISKKISGIKQEREIAERNNRQKQLEKEKQELESIKQNEIHTSTELLIGVLTKEVKEKRQAIEGLQTDLNQAHNKIEKQTTSSLYELFALHRKEGKQRAAILWFALLSLALIITIGSMFLTGGLTSPFVAFLLAKAFIVGSVFTSSTLGAGVIGGLTLYAVCAAASSLLGVIFTAVKNFFWPQAVLTKTEKQQLLNSNVKLETIKAVAKEYKEGMCYKGIFNGFGCKPSKKKAVSNDFEDENVDKAFHADEVKTNTVTTQIEGTTEDQDQNQNTQSTFVLGSSGN